MPASPSSSVVAPAPLLHPTVSLAGHRSRSHPPASQQQQPTSSSSSTAAPPPPAHLPPLSSTSASSRSSSPSSTHTAHTPSSSASPPSFLTPARPAPPASTLHSVSRGGPPPTPPDLSSSSNSGPSSPTPPATPVPSSSSASSRETVTAARVAMGIRDLYDREGVHQGEGGVDGLEYGPGWVESRPVLGIIGGTTVRAITADDFAHMEALHLALDVPETALFPWLHGMGDGNPNLDEFFSSFPGYRAQRPAPRYRGLTTLLAPGPGDVPPAGWSWDDAGRLDILGRSRTGSMASVQSTSSISGASERSSWSSASSSFTSGAQPSTPSLTSTTSTSTSASSTSSLLYQQHSSGTAHPPRRKASFPLKRCLLTSAVPACEVLTLAPLKRSTRSNSHGASNAPAPRRRQSHQATASEGSTLSSSSSSSSPGSSSGTSSAGEELSRSAEDHEARTGDRKVGRFVDRKVGHSICLRNLSLQVAKYATISDIVIYHPDGQCASSVNVAERCAEAIETIWRERKSECLEGQEPVRYHVYLVTDPFLAFEARHPELVAFDSRGTPRNKIDLFQKEKIETIALTRAQEVSPGFWMGNSFDCPNATGEEGEEGDFSGHLNPLGFDVCIEAFDGAEIPDQDRLNDASNYLATARPKPREHPQPPTTPLLSHALASVTLTSPRTASDPTIIASPDSSPNPSSSPSLFPSLDDLAKAAAAPAVVPVPHPNQIYHLQCVSTSLICPQGDWRALADLATEIIGFVRWNKRLTDEGRRILIHGFDGYTETSIFGLCYIMVVHNISLPEAYVHLHLHSRRSFFVYPHDLPLLRRVEEQLSHERLLVPAIPATPTSRSSLFSPFTAAPTSTSTSPPQGSTLAGAIRWKSGWTLGWKAREEQQQQQAAMQVQSSPRNEALSIARQEARQAEIRKHNAWFNSPMFEGSFPSRILEFLYLGNINHASNPQMLQALDITHIVSVGESALVDPSRENGRANHHPYGPPSPSSTHPPNYALWYEHQAGRMKVLDMQCICDDGVSPLRPAIAEAVEWIEQARLDGGKVLVHCKVGVSRSATVTIAYLMKHCNYSLIDAYMLTRARRLNVLIQPNLKFLFELQGWEVEISREKVEAQHGLRPMNIDDPSGSSSSGKQQHYAQRSAAADSHKQRLHGRKAMSWPIMTREIALLNHRYLGNN